MSRKTKLLLGLLIVLVVVGTWFASRHLSTLDWIQKVTGVQLPRGIQEVSIYGNRDFFTTAHVLLPPNAIQEFIKGYRFMPVTNAEPGLLGLENLDPRFRSVPQTADLVAYEGRSLKNKWRFVLDRRSGHLWVTVLYPDLAGDPP